MAITLHEEIAAIFAESDREWMTTAEIADEVNRRGRYQKRDGSLVSPFQIHGRTRNYSHLFDREGSRVRLRARTSGPSARSTTAGRGQIPRSGGHGTDLLTTVHHLGASGADELVAQLTDLAHRLPASSWPDREFMDGPGLYAWWTDESGAADLTEGLGHDVSPGLIYAGQTGGTTVGGVQRLATLRSRIGGNHLRGRIRGSTFRFTLAAALMAPLSLIAEAPKRLMPASEARLTAWMLRHLSVSAVAIDDRALVLALEHVVLARLDPPLNLDGMRPTSLRGQISLKRRDLGRGALLRNMGAQT
jgi:hypothetical protein